MSETLHAAARANDLQFARMLLARGALIDDIQQRTGDTPLLVAIEHNHSEMVQLLLESGANPNLPGKNGDSPLHRAVDIAIEEAKALLDTTNVLRPPSTKILVTLLQHGADPKQKNRLGASPIDWAKELGFTEGLSLFAAQ